MNQEMHKCPVSNLFMQLSKQRTLLILHSLAMWENSFSWLKKSLWWISSRTLSLRLKDLQEMWFICREIVREQPVKIEYSLSKKWESLTHELEKLWNWAREWDKKQP